MIAPRPTWPPEAPSPKLCFVAQTGQIVLLDSEGRMFPGQRKLEVVSTVDEVTTVTVTLIFEGSMEVLHRPGGE